MGKKTWIIVIIISVLIILSLFFFQNNDPEEITVGYSALRISLPIFVAVEKGYFEDEGLNVKLERFDTAQPLMQSLIAGNIQIAGYTALPITYSSMIRGEKELYFVTSMLEDSDHPISYFLVKSDSPADIAISDFEGKKIGVLPTIAYQKWLEVILKENGVEVENVEIVPINPALQPTALESGQVDALFTNDPAAITAVERGIAREISDEVLVPKYFGEPFIFGSFNIDKKFADANPETTKKIIKALDKGVGFVNNNPDEAKIIMKNFVDESQNPYVESYPDALYLTSVESSGIEFQEAANKYLEMGIIEKPVNVSSLIVTEDSF